MENLVKYQIVFKHYDHDCTLLSKNIPKCFWVIDWITMLLLKLNGGWAHFWILQEKRTFMILLIGVWIKTNYQLKSTSFILFKSSFKFFADKSLLCITEELDVWSANSLGFETKLSDNSFIYFKKSSGPRIEPRGTKLPQWPMLNVDH